MCTFGSGGQARSTVVSQFEISASGAALAGLSKSRQPGRGEPSRPVPSHHGKPHKPFHHQREALTLIDGHIGDAAHGPHARACAEHGEGLNAGFQGRLVRAQLQKAQRKIASVIFSMKVGVPMAR
jgi:hypothetical protein